MRVSKGILLRDLPNAKEHGNEKGTEVCIGVYRDVGPELGPGVQETGLGFKAQVLERRV